MKVTDWQATCWEAFSRLGNIRAASDELNVAPFAVRDAVERYWRNSGNEGPIPGLKLYQSRKTASELSDAHRRIAELERLLARQTEVNAALMDRISLLEVEAQPWADVHAKLDALLERGVTGTKVITLDHRRVKDGGQTKRQQLRMARG